MLGGLVDDGELKFRCHHQHLSTLQTLQAGTNRLDLTLNMSGEERWKLQGQTCQDIDQHTVTEATNAS
jgi:hypothetical protein